MKDDASDVGKAILVISFKAQIKFHEFRMLLCIANPMNVRQRVFIYIFFSTGTKYSKDKNLFSKRTTSST